MKKNKLTNAINIIFVSIIIIGVALCTSIYSKRTTPSSSSKINLNFDMGKWSYDELNKVYYQLGVSYCAKQVSEENQRFDIYVPGEYLSGKKNKDGTYKCVFDEKAEKNGYNVKTAPMIISIQSKESIKQDTHKEFNYEEISDYINEGYIYIWPGMRGLEENQKPIDDEEYSNAIIEGITDLKALVRFCRFNRETIPGNSEKILAYGTKGGGTKSTVLGASGDSELYSSKLFAIGAIMQDTDGKIISDSVNGTMCASPTNNLEISEKAFAWSIAQYIENKNIEENNIELAKQYADYLNRMKFKSEDGSLLYLDKTKQGTYTSGTYYNYMLAEVEKSINLFLQNRTFPYVDSNNNTIETPKAYVDSLNQNVNWIIYEENTNTVKIKSFKDCANYFGDKIQVESKNCLNEYNPYFYLSNKYGGLDSTYISRRWNICTIIDKSYNNFLPEENLKLILEKNEDVRKINHSFIWGIGYTEKEKEKIIFDNLKNWIKSCY